MGTFVPYRKLVRARGLERGVTLGFVVASMFLLVAVILFAPAMIRAAAIRYSYDNTIEECEALERAILRFIRDTGQMPLKNNAWTPMGGAGGELFLDLNLLAAATEKIPMRQGVLQTEIILITDLPNVKAMSLSKGPYIAHRSGGKVLTLGSVVPDSSWYVDSLTVDPWHQSYQASRNADNRKIRIRSGGPNRFLEISGADDIEYIIWFSASTGLGEDATDTNTRDKDLRSKRWLANRQYVERYRPVYWLPTP